MKKRLWITTAIIIGTIIFSIIIINSLHNGTPSETAKCIGKNAVLYSQLGCHACKIQEKLFGENSKYLNIIDCWFEQEKCSGITHTPTWIIKEKKYTGVLSIKELQELTGCN